MTNREFEELYRENFDLVYRYALGLTRDVHAAEELTQETFFKALQAIDGFRGECGLKTWLCGIAKNKFISQQRQKKPEPLEELPEVEAPGESPESAALRRDESMRLHRLLHELPEPYKEVFSLRVFGQLGFREIGALFGKTENWACVTFHRAKAKINANRKAEEE